MSDKNVAKKILKNLNIETIDSNNIEEATENYYKLKNKYDKQKDNLKNKILKNKDLSSRQKKNLLREKTLCVVCQQPGGTLFTIKNRTLVALCKADTPCNLDIKITKGTYFDNNEFVQILKDNSLSLRTDIIMSKLNLLFRLEDEETMLKNFEELKNDYLRNEKDVTKFLTVIENNLQTAEKKLRINKLKEELKKEMTAYKSLLKNAKQEKLNNNLLKSKVFLKDAVEKYREAITSRLDLLRKEENNYIYLSEVTVPNPKNRKDAIKQVTLYKEPYTIEDLEVEIVPPEVLSYKIF
jgi:hypothetical protein